MQGQKKFHWIDDKGELYDLLKRAQTMFKWMVTP